MPKELCVLATGQEISEGNCGVFSFQKEKKNQTISLISALEHLWRKKT